MRLSTVIVLGVLAYLIGHGLGILLGEHVVLAYGALGFGGLFLLSKHWLNG